MDFSVHRERHHVPGIIDKVLTLTSSVANLGSFIIFMSGLSIGMTLISKMGLCLGVTYVAD